MEETNDFQCDLCDECFFNQQSLDAHKARKFPCYKTATNFACGKCEKPYTKLNNMYRHQKTCNGRQPKVFKDRISTVNRLKEENEQLKAALSRANQPIFNGDININNNVTNNITVRNLSNENIQYILSMTNEQLKENLCFAPNYESILSMIKLVHLNRDHPENFNFAIENNKAKMKNPIWNVHSTVEDALLQLVDVNHEKFYQLPLSELLDGKDKGELESYLDNISKIANDLELQDGHTRTLLRKLRYMIEKFQVSLRNKNPS